eukprot:23976-Eustigmatos_ZCMA.PRE.1
MDNPNPEDGYASVLNRYCSKSKNRLKVEAKNRTKETPSKPTSHPMSYRVVAHPRRRSSTGLSHR